MNTILTEYGELTPQTTTDDLRKREVIPVLYHPNGTPKVVALEQQTTIRTPIGDLPAELLTFHENGAINRLFPLNGKLSGYWSESDEASLAAPLTILSPAGAIRARVISVCFHNDGALRSLTLWPGETISIKTPAGYIETRIGMSFHQNGTLRSAEPARPTEIPTPVGTILAFDPDAVGVNGDDNSLCFDEKGNLTRIVTVSTIIKTIAQNGKTAQYGPALRDSLCGDTEKEISPMTVAFKRVAMNVYNASHAPSARVDLRSTICLTEQFIPAIFNSSLGATIQSPSSSGCLSHQ